MDASIRKVFFDMAKIDGFPGDLMDSSAGKNVKNVLGEKKILTEYC